MIPAARLASASSSSKPRASGDDPFLYPVEEAGEE